MTWQQIKSYWNNVAKYLGTVASHMHIYDSFQESLIKTLLFLVAFLVSVLPYYVNYPVLPSNSEQAQQTEISEESLPTGTPEILSQENGNVFNEDAETYIAVGGSLIVYGISLIAEVCMLLDPNDYLSKKICTGSILLIGVLMTAFGFMQIFVPKLFSDPKTAFIIGGLAIAVYVVDTTIFYFFKPVKPGISKSRESFIKNIHVRT